MYFKKCVINNVVELQKLRILILLFFFKQFNDSPNLLIIPCSLPKEGSLSGKQRRTFRCSPREKR